MDATDDENSPVDLYERAEKLGISHFLVCHSALNEGMRGVLVPKSAIKRIQKEGCGSHPYNCFNTPAFEDGMVFIPDGRTLIQLPWKPEIGWLMR